MTAYQPVMVTKLANILESVCPTLNEANYPTTTQLRKTIARRLIADHEAGIDDVEILKADALSAARNSILCV